MFSGHTTHGVILTAIVLRYGPAVRGAVAVALAGMTLLALSLLAFKDHYTSDVIVAIYVTSMVWMLVPQDPQDLDPWNLRTDTLLSLVPHVSKESSSIYP